MSDFLYNEAEFYQPTVTNYSCDVNPGAPFYVVALIALVVTMFTWLQVAGIQASVGARAIEKQFECMKAMQAEQLQKLHIHAEPEGN